MYGLFANGETPPPREPYGAELVVDCPTCHAKKGKTCVCVNGFGEHAGHPHNKRYIAAKMEWTPPT